MILYRNDTAVLFSSALLISSIIGLISERWQMRIYPCTRFVGDNTNKGIDKGSRYINNKEKQLMKRIPFFLILLLTTIHLFSCSSGRESKNDPLRDENVVLSEGNNVVLRVHVYQDSAKNLFVNAYDKNGYTYGSASVMFSDIVKDISIVKVYKLSNSPYKEYVIQTYDLGSTYGAKSLIIIWYDGNVWRVNRDIFQGATIEDRDKDGIFEIIEYYHSKDRNGDIYRFSNGNFEPAMY